MEEKDKKEEEEREEENDEEEKEEEEKEKEEDDEYRILRNNRAPPFLFVIANYKKLKEKSEVFLQNSSKKWHFLNSDFKSAWGTYYAEYDIHINVLASKSSYFGRPRAGGAFSQSCFEEDDR